MLERMKIACMLLALWCGLPVAAQVTVQVGPNPAPLGAPVFASVTNNMDLIMGIGGCPWSIVDQGGALVFQPTCIVQELLVGPIGTVNYRWDQVDSSATPVAAWTSSPRRAGSSRCRSKWAGSTRTCTSRGRRRSARTPSDSVDGRSR
jgi:hypothetical protein